MKHFLFFLFAGISLSLHAQTAGPKTFERKGFIFGGALGISYIQLSAPAGFSDDKQVGLSFPNLKFGAMLTPRTALLLYLPGTVYTYKNEGRERSRGFEGMIPSVQYWAGERLWLLAGVGLGMNAPAFYDIKDESERKFYFGTAALAGAGYEVFRKGRFALDVQGRIHYGQINLPDRKEKGVAFSVMVGVNWY